MTTSRERAAAHQYIADLIKYHPFAWEEVPEMLEGELEGIEQEMKRQVALHQHNADRYGIKQIKGGDTK